MTDVNYVEPGDKVHFLCHGILDDGTVVDLRDDDRPFHMVAGSNGSDGIWDHLAQALVGMRPAQTKQLALRPRDAFGEYREILLKQVSSDLLPPNTSIGDTVELVTQETGRKEKASGTVIKIEDARATVDFNHPLAGKRLTLEIDIL